MSPPLPELLSFLPQHPALSKAVETSPLCSHKPKEKSGFNYSLKAEGIGFLVLCSLFHFLTLPLAFLIFSFLIFSFTLHLAIYCSFFFSLLSNFLPLVLYLTSVFYLAVSFISMLTLSFLCCLLCIGYPWILCTIVVSHPFHYLKSSLCCHLCCFHRLTEWWVLEGTSVGHLVQPLAKAESSTAGCTGHHPGRF